MTPRHIGHQPQWSQLQKTFTEGRMPAAYLFYGMEGIGKRKVASTFVQWCFCAQKSDFPCGGCSSCKRVEQKTHPDFFLLEADNETIKIDQIRDLQKKLSKAPLEAPLKIVLIDNAQELTLQASNSLLKVIEEPPANTLFIFIAPNLFRLLPTIRSRCRKIYFHPPSLAEASEWLATQCEKSPEQIRPLLEALDGSLGLFLKLNDEVFEEALDKLKRVLQKRDASFGEMSAFSQEMVEKKVEMVLLLELLKKQCFRHIVRENHWQGMKQIDLLSRAQQDMEQNVNKILVLENLFLNWQNY